MKAFKRTRDAQLKAIVYTRYGSPDVLQLKEIEEPTPKDDQVLVRIHAASVNAYDWHMLRAKPFLVRISGSGFLRPKITVLGADIAGTVEAVGSDAKQFHPGDEVFGTVSRGFAEYACAREKYLALKPANMSFEEAAAVPLAGITALQGLRDKGQIQRGEKVLISGASGGVGTFAVQIANRSGPN
jgi:NADPH:quinone reductase-like Zn-dependent oxidoreductase